MPDLGKSRKLVSGTSNKESNPRQPESYLADGDPFTNTG
jgi:hypothetical protein